MKHIIQDYRPFFIAIGTFLIIITFLFLCSALYFVMAGIDLYLLKPWSIFEVMYYSNDPLMTSRLWVAFGLPGLAMSFVLFKSYELFLGVNDNQYADACWANNFDLSKAGLIKNKGLFLGKYKNEFIRCDKDTHSIVVAPTRSGKGVGIIIPNLLTWRGSVVCLDIKHENFKLTAGIREKYGHEVFMWAPGDSKNKSHGFNPFDQISKDPRQCIQDIRRIAGIMLPDPPHDIFWVTEARSLFIGLALYVIDRKDVPSTLGSIYRLLSCEAELGDICRYIIKTHPHLSLEILSFLHRFANKAAKERSGVKSTLDAAMQPWSEPKIDAATSESSFQIDDLRKKQISVYIGVKPGQLKGMSAVIRIFFEFLVNKMTTEEPDPKKEPHELLILLDEIHTLGKMDIMTRAFTLSAGFKCRVMAVVQQYSWLDEVYNKNIREGVVGNCTNKVFYRAGNLSQAKEISEMLGKRMVKMVSRSQKNSFKYEPATKTTSLQEKPLMSADKIMRLNKSKEILFCDADYPVLCNKIVYYKDPAFKNRVMPPPEIPELEFIPHELPKFNVGEKQQNPKRKDDPDQGNLFKKTAKELGDDLDDKPDKDDREDGFPKQLDDDLN